ncbi:unnamed protein product [Psylliodes chrysocephalus]|uniref:Uncharacterized protein n=1 Tax=Psylliodes chrysocephalus TaxID=3402493 RepID=A0A9P0GAN9_9CUCU|nr:unnamed protein product [Psylliodes chrysocephala]
MLSLTTQTWSVNSCKTCQPIKGLINSSHQLLDLLYEISTQNENRTPNKNTFNPTIKRFALYIFYIGGRLLYETLQANLKNALPSFSSLLRFANQEKKSCEEGVFDYAGLHEFLVARGQKKSCGLVKTPRELQAKSNTQNAVGKWNSRNRHIYSNFGECNSRIFSHRNKSALCIYCDGSAAFRKCIFLLHDDIWDRQFTFQDVQYRWKSMRQGLQRFGIKVAGFSSDGDTRLLKAMRLNSVLSISNGYETPKTTKSASESEPRSKRMDKSPEIRQLNEWKWYQIHILTKLRVRLLNSAVTLPMGNYIAELNGHSLFRLIVKARQNEDITNDMFLPWLFSSQSYEKLFRTTRSLTSTFSTVVNSSVKDILHCIDRIQSVNNILKDCTGTLPREDKKMDSNKLDFNLPDYDFRLSDQDKLRVVEDALQNSIEDAKALGITVSENCWNFVTVPVSRGKTFKRTDAESVLEPIENFQEAQLEELYEESEEEGRLDECNSHGVNLNDTNVISDVINKVNDSIELPEESDELRLDLCNVRLDQLGPDLQLKDYSDKK